KAKLRRAARGFEDDVGALKWNELADEDRGEGVTWFPARREHVVLCADETDLDRSVRQLREEPGLRIGVRDDDIGARKRMPVDALEDSRGHGPRLETCAVGNEGVCKRHERVEDDRPAAGRAPGGR